MKKQKEKEIITEKEFCIAEKKKPQKKQAVWKDEDGSK